VQLCVTRLTSDRKVEVEHFISERTHKPIALRFWVRVWRLSHLCGCSGLDVGGPPGSPRYPTVVLELWFDEGFDRLLVSKVLLTKGVQVAGSVVCGDNGGTSISVRGRKSLCLRDEHDELMGSHLSGRLLCASVCYMSHIERKVEIEHFISERTHKSIVLSFWIKA